MCPRDGMSLQDYPGAAKAVLPLPAPDSRRQRLFFFGERVGVRGQRTPLASMGCPLTLTSPRRAFWALLYPRRGEGIRFVPARWHEPARLLRTTTAALPLPAPDSRRQRLFFFGERVGVRGRRTPFASMGLPLVSMGCPLTLTSPRRAFWALLYPRRGEGLRFVPARWHEPPRLPRGSQRGSPSPRP